MTGDPSCGPLRLSIDTSALTANWKRLNQLSGTAKAGAAVKADGYGLGIAAIAPALWTAGCRDYFAAHWSEAAVLANLIPASAVAVLHGPLTNEDAAYARGAGIRPVINSLHQARLWLDCGGGLCDLMIDTGINRLGIPLAHLGDPLVHKLQIDVLHSHLASADEDVPQNEQQRLAWDQARGQISHRRASLANSAGIALGSAYHGDLTRPGLALYGGIPCAALSPHIFQVVHPEAAIMQVRELSAGDCVGYNATFTATHEMRVGVVSLGYADGYLRCWSGKGTMRSGDAILPVLGRVSMDMTVIDLTSAPHLTEGDWVTVDYALPEAAAKTGLSQYELLTGLGHRFAR